MQIGFSSQTGISRSRSRSRNRRRHGEVGLEIEGLPDQIVAIAARVVPSRSEQLADDHHQRGRLQEVEERIDEPRQRRSSAPAARSPATACASSRARAPRPPRPAPVEWPEGRRGPPRRHRRAGRTARCTRGRARSSGWRRRPAGTAAAPRRATNSAVTSGTPRTSSITAIAAECSGMLSERRPSASRMPSGSADHGGSQREDHGEHEAAPLVRRDIGEAQRPATEQQNGHEHMASAQASSSGHTPGPPRGGDREEPRERRRTTTTRQACSAG